MHETQAVGGYQGFSFVCILYTLIPQMIQEFTIHLDRQTGLRKQTKWRDNYGVISLKYVKFHC